MSNVRSYDVVILGAGAAGLMCALQAGRRGRSILVIEGNERPGRKILISGGGRCNFTNLFAAPEHYISNNLHFCKSALARFTPGDVITMVEEHGIAYHEKKLGQLFCDGSASAIVEMLTSNCAAAGVAIETHEVRSVTRDAAFSIETDRGRIEAPSLVVATGGLSIAKLGASDLGYRLAQQFGLDIVPTRPGLVPLTFSGEDLSFCAGLSGVSLDVVASCNGQSFRENLLFTHYGLSGPAILQISSYWREGDAISIDLLPDYPAAGVLDDAVAHVRDLIGVLGDKLPRRFAQAWCERQGWTRPVARYSEREQERIAEELHAWQAPTSGTQGYGKAEVTVGGIDTNGLSSRTMEARNVPGLYFIGEVVDVTGWLGGYNFQWAWASGCAAGLSV